MWCVGELWDGGGGAKGRFFVKLGCILSGLGRTKCFSKEPIVEDLGSRWVRGWAHHRPVKTWVVDWLV